MCLLDNCSLTFNMKRRVYSRVMKPRPSRKLSSKARINLNRYWNELEELYGETYQDRVTQFEQLVLHNELNDNAINEAREAATAALKSSQVDMDLGELLTPPPTPMPTASATPAATFTFGSALSIPDTLSDQDLPSEEDDHDLPLTPCSPAAWSVFDLPLEASLSSLRCSPTTPGSVITSIRSSSQ